MTLKFVLLNGENVSRLPAEMTVAAQKGEHPVEAKLQLAAGMDYAVPQIKLFGYAPTRGGYVVTPDFRDGPSPKRVDVAVGESKIIEGTDDYHGLSYKARITGS